MGFFIPSNGPGGWYFARLLSLWAVVLVHGSRCTSGLQMLIEGQLLLFLLLQAVPITALQESRSAHSPGSVNMSWPFSSIIGGKITPACSCTPRYLCLSPLSLGKDNTTSVVTSLVSK